MKTCGGEFDIIETDCAKSPEEWCEGNNLALAYN
eukprot:CAMPEP_0170102206 /NCGR_PEP_ID=MMETSP0020_2-20130122/2740_1 /TAXON_ID=98059 /ORGANISM="Dinobryon sp., Strain UTEXLB2267" /LENGTH=33 /DNA_ID= /DNA_START= /DNA_END= /DNA_ORIENTATION=